MCGLYEVRFSRMVDIDELLRIAANDWEPRALNLNHDFVAFEKAMTLVA